MSYRCFKKDCEFEAQYVRKCLLSEIYCCETHFKAQSNYLNKPLAFESSFAESFYQTKNAILRFLIKKKLKKEALKKSILTSRSQNHDITKESIEETLRNLEFYLERISEWIKKIFQAYKVANKEKDPLLNLLTLQPDRAITKLRAVIQQTSEHHSNFRRFFWLNELRAKTSDIWNKQNIYEQDFRNTCEFYENQKLSSDPLLNNDYQEFVKAYHQNKSIYYYDDKTRLFIYDTEEENEAALKFKVQTQSHIPVKLPNDEIFFKYKISEYEPVRAAIIDRNGGFRVLPSSFFLIFPLIYFNGSIYCYGFISGSYVLARFDLDKNRWKYLSIMQDKSIRNSVKFKGNILIAFYDEVLLYSTAINSFSTITYKCDPSLNAEVDKFCPEYNNNLLRFDRLLHTFLIQADERLYIIDFFDKYLLVYESDVEDEYTWKSIAKSAFDGFNTRSCLYNKRKIYILKIPYGYRYYCKFDLDLKSFTENSYIYDFVTLKEADKKLVAIEWYNQTFKFDLDSADICFKKGDTIQSLGRKLNSVEICSRKIEHGDCQAYYNKGKALMELYMYIEAIEYFNEALSIKPYHQSIRFYYDIWYNKGDSFQELGRYIEAIECYDQAYKILYLSNALIKKGFILLYNLGNSLEAIKCYDEIIKTNPNDSIGYRHRGDALSYDLGWNIETLQCYYKIIENKHNATYADSNEGSILYTLERNLEAVEYYNKAIELDFKDYIAYNNKGAALNILGRNDEAIECYKKAIDINSDNFLSFCNRARAFIDLEYEAEALKDLNTAYNIMQKTVQESCTSYSAKLKIYELNCNYINDTIKDCYLKLLKKLIELQEYAIKFKNKSQKIINFALSNQAVMSHIETQKKEINTQNSQLLRRFIEILAINKYQPYEEVQQKLYDIEKEADKIEKLVTENIFDLKSIFEAK